MLNTILNNWPFHNFKFQETFQIPASIMVQAIPVFMFQICRVQFEMTMSLPALSNLHISLVQNLPILNFSLIAKLYCMNFVCWDFLRFNVGLQSFLQLAFYCFSLRAVIRWDEWGKGPRVLPSLTIAIIGKSMSKLPEVIYYSWEYLDINIRPYKFSLFLNIKGRRSTKREDPSDIDSQTYYPKKLSIAPMNDEAIFMKPCQIPPAFLLHFLSKMLWGVLHVGNLINTLLCCIQERTSFLSNKMLITIKTVFWDFMNNLGSLLLFSLWFHFAIATLDTLSFMKMPEERQWTS